jgi:transcriptional regulator with XRE-family HTH domain
MKGEHIKIVRKARKLTLADVAGRINKSPGYIHLIEQGYYPPLDVRIMLADALEVDVNQLFDLSTEERLALSILNGNI